MVEVRRLDPDDWPLWREVRLASLAEAPHAYGSTLARELTFDESMWRARLAPENGLSAVAVLDGRPVGAIGGYTAPDADVVMLMGMWAHPEHRGRGIADALVAELLAWARENAWSQVELRVADGNEVARKLFERHGFTSTGRGAPMESNPTIATETLARTV